MSRVFVFGMCIALSYPAITHGQKLRAYADENGRITYSSVPPYSERPLESRQDVESEEITTRSRLQHMKKTMGAVFPRVDAATQKARDDVRKNLLKDELNIELQLKQQALQHRDADAARLHDANIIALQKEIAFVKK